jgi:hypothetical protein
MAENLIGPSSDCSKCDGPTKATLAAGRYETSVIVADLPVCAEEKSNHNY